MDNAGHEPKLTNEPDDVRISIESLGSSEPRKPRSVAWRPLLNALTVVVAVGLIVALVGVYRSAHGGNASISPTATLALGPTATPPAGWRFGTVPRWAQRIAFSVTQPETGYVCGAQGLIVVTTPAQISIGVTHDGGRSWSSSTLPGKGQWCDISIDPTNARDVAVMVAQTVAFTQPLALYRSFDAQHWRAESLPADSGGGALAFVLYQWAWAGATLFVAPVTAGDQETTRLAASVDGRPFVRVERGLFGIDARATSINLLIGLARTLYVVFGCGGCSTPPTHLARTRDDGATWTAFAPSYQGKDVFPVAASADSTTLFGGLSYSQTPQYLRSHDEGATWESLPLGPNSMFAYPMLAAPDGTLYAEFTPVSSPVASPSGIYRLLPGGAMWVYIAPLPGDEGGPVALSWNSAGRPAGLWGTAFQPEPDSVVTQGIEYHQP